MFFIVFCCFVVLSSILLPDAAAEEEKRQIPGITVEKGGDLLQEGRFTLEPTFQYAHSSSRQLVSISGFTVFDAIHIGKIEVKDVERDIYIPSVTARLGFKNREVSVKIPWLYRRDKETNAAQNGATVYSAQDGGLGDLEAGLMYKLVEEHGSAPDILFSLGVKSTTGRSPYGLTSATVNGVKRLSEFPTGSGHWGYSGGLVFVKTSDPAILFFNMTYFYNVKKSIGTKAENVDGNSQPVAYGDIDPGDSFEYAIGTVIALNEKFSMNFSLNQRFTQDAVQNGVHLQGTDLNAGSFSIGATYAVSDRLSIDVSTGIGLTKDSNDMTLQIRIPYGTDF
ncbi:MAG: transporter [Pseudomonadota bacterium]